VAAVALRLSLPNCINFYSCWVYLLMQFGLSLSRRRSGHDLRQADVRCQRWGLRGLEERRKRLQDE
jgi:hypothetical protein